MVAMAACCATAHLVSPPSLLISASARSSSFIRMPSQSVRITAGGNLMQQRQERPQTAFSRLFRWVVRAQEDDFEIEDAVEYEAEKGDEDEEEEIVKDYEIEYDAKSSDRVFPDSDTFVSTEGEAAEMVVPYKIREEEFHKFSLYTCDFFIRKVPDPDDDAYDFREMYVTAPDTDVYAIPSVDGRMPKRRVRLARSNYECICVSEPPVDPPRSPLYKTEMQVVKVFLIKHYKNRRMDAWNFALDFEEIYVIDSKTKSISRARVIVNVPGGRYRDRSDEVLTVLDDGTTFRVIPASKRKSPDEVVGAKQWKKTKEDLDNYLRGFRDYDVSNWF
eukprot:c25160_g1_i2 orf=153-1148(+)